MPTIEEIKEAVVTQPELKTALLSSFKDDFHKSLESDGVIIRTKDQEAEYLKSYEEKVLPSKVDARFQERFKPTLDEMDNAVIELTGEKKMPNEKTTDFLKRAVKSLSGRGGDPVTKEKVAQLEKMLADKETEWSTKYNEAVSKSEQREIDSEVESALKDKNFPFPAHVTTDEQKKAYAEGQKRMLKTDFTGSLKPKRDADGNLVWYDGEKPLMSTKDGKPLSAKEIIEEKYSPYFVPAGKVATGTGQGANGVVVTPGSFKSVDDIHKFLAASGVEVGSKDYNSQLSKLAQESKITI